MSGDNLRVNGERLWAMLMETAQFGATPKGGIKRLALSDEDKLVREWFVVRCQEAGCAVRVDELGNIFARRPGRNNELPPIAMGSHLDTQPTGGKFDGIVGVLAGLEVLRTLNDAGIETNAPIEVIDWTNEEGSRFAPAMLSSGVYAGVCSKDYAYARQDREGLCFGAELERIGFKGTAPCRGALSAFFEMHIEQGPILEDEQKTIGIVTGVQGMRWYEATVTGMDCHAGSTPMRLRKDALVLAARMIEAVQAAGLRYAPDAVATVGLVEVRPNSRNVIPGEVFFTIDLRHPEDEIVAAMEADLRAEFAKILEGTSADLALERIWDSPAVHYDPKLIEAVAEASAELGYPSRRIVSGAGHDAAYIARIAPTTMLFIPCEKGISHNEAEKTEPEQVTAGANVLLRAVLATDARLAA